MNPQDPLTRLRRQLVDAATEQAKPAPAKRRWQRRPALWVSLAALVAVPAGATAAGLIDLTDSGTTAKGSTYTMGTLTDDQASYDPTTRDGVGRACDTIRVLNRDGSLKLTGKSCRPKGYQDTAPIRAGYEQLDGELLLSGTTTATATTVEILGRDEPVSLKPVKDQRRFFTVLVPLGKYTLIARNAKGSELGRSATGY